MKVLKIKTSLKTLKVLLVSFLLFPFSSCNEVSLKDEKIDLKGMMQNDITPGQEDYDITPTQGQMNISPIGSSTAPREANLANPLGIKLYDTTVCQICWKFHPHLEVLKLNDCNYYPAFIGYLEHIISERDSLGNINDYLKDINNKYDALLIWYFYF